MFRLAGEARLSPEKMAAILGVSGMTLRRWRAKPQNEDLPKLYERAFEAGVQRMVVDGQVDASSSLAQSMMSHSNERSFQATLKTLGFSDALLEREGDPQDAMIEGISQIGANPSRMKQVDAGRKKLWGFAGMGAEWKARVQGLWSIIHSPKLRTLDKFVAYGALFYLLTPFDLIPDSIPVFGLLDDFAILGLALAYYSAVFPDIVAASASNKEKK